MTGELSTIEEEAEAFFSRYAFPDHLRAHSLVVGRVAAVLARAHREAGTDLVESDVVLAAYLHDIGRSPLLEGDEREHNELSALILAAEGRPSLIEPARRHPVYVVDDPARAPRTLADKIVHLADRRAELAVVSLEERIAGVIERYPGSKSKRDAWLAASRALEHEVLFPLRMAPHELAGLVG